MKRHQNLTGAVNPGNHCFSVGSIASFTFWAYGSGCDLVILGVDLQPIHIIPGHTKDYKLISCLDCSPFSGKIAASYGRDIVIYRPKLVRGNKDAVPVFTWVEESVLSLEENMGPACVLSWASSGKKILVGCSEILLWGVENETHPQHHKEERNLKVHFLIDEITEEEQQQSFEENDPQSDSQPTGIKWVLLWQSGMKEHPREVQFSPDDELFASVSQGDTMIRVWHRRSTLTPDLSESKSADAVPTRVNGFGNHGASLSADDAYSASGNAELHSPQIDYTFTYLIHPKPVVGFSWRKGVPLLPSGTVPNVLISSCMDNTCRVWCETLTPDADIRKLSTRYPTSSIRPFASKKKTAHDRGVDSDTHVKKSISAPVMNHDSTDGFKIKNFEKPAPRLFRHFHIAATINPISDIPLLPSMTTATDCVGDDDCGSLYFTVHWLDNKHHHAMAHLNKILHEAMTETRDLEKETLDHESDVESVQSGVSIAKPKTPSLPSSPINRPSGFTAKFPVWDSSKPESVDAYLSCLASPVSPDIQSHFGLSLPQNVYELLRQAWLDQSDALFAIHPTDGSLLVWHISYLDENRCGQIRQTQVSFSSRIPMAIPTRDASTLCSRVVLYANHYSAHLSFDSEGVAMNGNQKSQEASDNNDQSEPDVAMEEMQMSPSINLLSKHSDGSLNQWEISFSASAGYSTVASITHRSRFCGHRYHMSGIFCHPTLPLLVTTSHHRHLKELADGQQRASSELILWRVDPVGALCHSGGISELARMNGSVRDDFRKVAWFPVLFPSWCLGSVSTSPSTCLLSMHGSALNVYQVVVDAAPLLNGMGAAAGNTRQGQTKLGQVASQQSSTHPGCLLLLETLPLGENCDSADILLLNIFPEEQFARKDSSHPQASEHRFGAKRGHEITETFLIVMVKKSTGSSSNCKIVAKTWRVIFTASMEAVTGAKSCRSHTFAMSDSSDNTSDNDYTPEESVDSEPCKLSYLNITSRFLNSQVLNHLQDANIVIACEASDPLSSSLFPHSQTLSFSLLTVDDEGQVYFWQGAQTLSENTIEWVSCNDFSSQRDRIKDLDEVATPQIRFVGRPVVVKMAHCCMLACLSVSYSTSRSKTLCYVSVYECLSSGGSHWRLQDRLFAGEIDSTLTQRSYDVDGNLATSVHLDWLSREDGTFLLTVNIGRKIKIYTQSPVSMHWEEPADSSRLTIDEPVRDTVVRPTLKRQTTLDIVTRQKLLGSHRSSRKSMDVEHGKGGELFSGLDHLLCWSLLSEVSLGNSTGLSATHLDNVVTQKPQPVMVSWVRNGLLLVATETEMHVFCHWMERNHEEKVLPKNPGVLYGSASLSQSAPEGLCQYMMKDSVSQESTNTCSVVSLMSVADVLCPSLPQYHPLVLSELMNGGRLGTVKHVLINLAMMVNGQLEPKDDLVHVEPIKLKKFGLAVDEEAGNAEQKTAITPLLLYDLLDDDGQVNKLSQVAVGDRVQKPGGASSPTKGGKRQSKTDYEDLFSTTVLDDEIGLELDLDHQPTTYSTDTIDLTEFEPGYIGSEHCQVLHRYLSRNLLPDLNSLDQMELMAIADTVANAAETVASNAAEEAAGLGVDSGGRGYASSGNTGTESMDKCGLRFVFAMHNHLCLLRSLPAAQRAKLLRQGLASCHFAWAFHSDAEEEMLSLIASVKRSAPEWDELKSFGVGWWIRSTVTLRRLVEQTARAAFQKDSNPLDAAVFYMALNKKNVLKGLFKSVHEDRMTNFFSQDFSEDRWHRAALKNAFALMGKQRFQEAAAFFLLADCVEDAVEVCLEKMQDIQLASIIVRLYNQDAARSYSGFLQKYILGGSEDAAEVSSGETKRKVHRDPFIRSMAHWALGSYEDALMTLLKNDSQEDSLMDSSTSITDIFNFYNYLRTHPLIMKQKKINQANKDENLNRDVDDRISVEERMLYFATATYHLDAGCPLLSLDVLSSLPPLKQEESTELDATVFGSPKPEEHQNDISSSMATSATATSATANSLDWGEQDLFAAEVEVKDELELDWSESEESEEPSDDEDKEEKEKQPPLTLTNPIILKKEEVKEKQVPAAKAKNAMLSDVYASQLRFTACLRIFVSELKSLAATTESEGHQIRDKLVSWLEKETKVLQKMLPPCAVELPCLEDETKMTNDRVEAEGKSGFSSDTESDGDHVFSRRKPGTESMSPAGLVPAPSLHELYMAEKQDWKQKREHISQRRRWLRQYRRFLRTLLSYCCLHDDERGSLSPLRMELLLLLQESLQEKTPHQLSSPLPNPTSIPLLSSSVAACRTVVADPTSRLSHMSQDILACFLEMSDPPPYPSWTTPHASTAMICRQAEALSSCIYQSLCDTNSQNYRARMLDGEHMSVTDSHFTTASVTSTTASESHYVPPSTQPSQWPGVVSLQALLNSDDNRPRLIVLLCEALVAVCVSLLVHGLQTCNSLLLYRLVNRTICDKTWRAVFGGGARVVTRYRPAPVPVGSPSRSSDGCKVRDRLTHKVLSYSLERKNSLTSSNSADTSLYREKFVAPETTLWECFLSKPLITASGADEVGFESDSDAEDDDAYSDEASLDEFGEVKTELKGTEHGNAFSYSWHILRLAVVRSVLHNLKTFLPTTGLELSELGTSSPMLNSTLQLLSQWQLSLTKELEAFKEPPANYITGVQGVGSSLRGRPAILKYQAMLDPNNTPFSGVSLECLGARRLWHCLVRHENLQDIFIRYIFQKTGGKVKGQGSAGDHSSSSPGQAGMEKKTSGVQKKLETRRATISVMFPNEGANSRQTRSDILRNEGGVVDGRLGKVKILHKETEIISSFCINNAKNSLVVLSTNHDVQELDVSTLLACDSWSWIEEDIPSTLLQQTEDMPKLTPHKEEDFLVVTRKQSMFVGSSAQAAPSLPWGNAVQTGQGATVLLKRTFSGVRRMASHPTLPYYLTGNHDGSIRMWEWGHQQQISLFRAAGQFPKVTNLHFSPLGNKISAVDADGYMALWQVSSPRKPFLYHQCHDRSTSDSCFMSSASVVATTGLSSNNCNIAIWDTLLPPRSMLVKDFHAHEGVGGTCLAYAAQHRTLVVGGRDGKVSVYDLRRPDKFLHCFVAHEAPVKCIGLSPDDRVFVTGSIVGDVRVWDVTSHLLAYNLSGEHARTSLFRNFGSGTMKVEIASPGNKVFSCGADGTLKLRVLPHDPRSDVGMGHSLSGRIQKLTLRRQVVRLANAIREECLVY